LCWLLGSTGVMGDPQDWFNENVNPRYRGLRKHGLPYLQRLAEDTATPNGLFGIRLFLVYLRNFGTAAEWSAIRERFSPQLIWLRRRDKLRQAISRYRAQQTHEWSRPTTAPPAEPPQFNARSIKRHYEKLVSEDAQWERSFHELEVCPWQVWYEELLADPQAAVDGICRVVDVSAPRVDPGRCPLAVQRDEVTEEWVRRLTA
jgi:LPS sulfotransferase NodH